MPEPVGLAFKAYEIEELADVYFFRPLGMVFARAARALGLTPTTVTMIGAGVGVVGGALLYDEHFNAAERRPQKGGEMGWILETNTSMNRGMEAMGGRVVKRYRVYERLLQTPEPPLDSSE